MSRYIFQWTAQVCALVLLSSATMALAQETSAATGSLSSASSAAPLTDRERMLLDRIDKLEQRLNVLEGKVAAEEQAPSAAVASPQEGALSEGAGSSSSAASNAREPCEEHAHNGPRPRASDSPVPLLYGAVGRDLCALAATPSSASNKAFSFADGTTLNFGLDGYYGYNFNHPTGRVNLLRANDPLSDSFSLNQADVIVERTPDLNAGRRFGYRLDLMFGQSTEILQGSTANEPRPQVYRNIFQAYGSYVLPIGSGLQVDFGKFASSLGAEGTYTKDQLNYSSSYFYNFLPFYHEGVRATYNVNSKIALQYWLVNGANQTEDFNGFKSQAALLTIKPNSKISWDLNYYEGQEQRDVTALYNPVVPVLPTQPGLSTNPVLARHDGRLQIVDTYATFDLGRGWSTTLEGDYVINRVASNSAPTTVYGGSAYLHRQMTKTVALNGRFTFLADPGGLFSGVSQDLKEATLTGVFQPVEGFQTRVEYRRDFSNRLFFLTNNPMNAAGAQNTLTLGMLWWFGGKQGSW